MPAAALLVADDDELEPEKRSDPEPMRLITRMPCRRPISRS
jgi:hypothetical protein